MQILFFETPQQSNLATLKSGMQAKISENRLAEMWLKLIDELTEDIR